MKFTNKLIIVLILLLITISPIFALESRPEVLVKQEGNRITEDSTGILRPEEQANASEILLFPESYDLRNVDGNNYVTPVKFQNPWNNCWAFAAVAAAESNALKNGAPTADFSERALTFFNYQLQGNKGSKLLEGYKLSSPSSIKNLSFQVGDNNSDPLEQLSTWNGASNEAQAPYQNDQGFKEEGSLGSYYSPNGTWNLPYDDNFDNSYHLQNYRSIKTNYTYTTENVNYYTNKVKEEIMNNGAVVVGLYLANEPYFNNQTNSQYVSKPTIPDHAATIIGWDDNYTLDNFDPDNQPPETGAWIVKNSYSSNWGDEGFFYLSYYDQSIDEFDSVNVETPETGYTYNQNLQHDFVGNKYGLSEICTNTLAKAFNQAQGDFNIPKVANVYSVNQDQIIKAFSFDSYYDTPTTIKTQIYLLNDGFTNPENGKLLTTQIDTVNTRGFHTLSINKPIIIESGQKFSIVQNVIYSNLIDENNKIINLPGLPIAYGIEESIQLPFNDIYSGKTQTADLEIETQVEPGESYVYGLSPFQGKSQQWSDLSDQNIQDELSMQIIIDNNQQEVTAHPGNVMTKVYTADIDPNNVPTTSIDINNGTNEIFLATPNAGSNVISSKELTAMVYPSGSSSSIVWSTSSAMVANISATSGDTITVNAVNEGKAIISATSGDASANIIVTVTNEPTVCETVEVSAEGPDYFTVIAKNVRANPALNIPDSKIAKVAVFSWSDDNQNDINAKEAVNIPGTQDWRWEGISVNGNDEHTYFNNANNIQINMYASLDPNTNGNRIAVAYYSWVNYVPRTESSVCYVGYSQNIGFDLPSVYNGLPAGTETNSNNLEGFRLSSNIPGVWIESKVHVQNLGWLDTVSDGCYAGTMHQNLGIEAVVLNLTGQNASAYQIMYRVLNKDGIWQPWVTNDKIAGTTGMDRQIQAIEVQIVQTGF